MVRRSAGGSGYLFTSKKERIKLGLIHKEAAAFQVIKPPLSAAL